jgi:hypothetical protein
MPTNNSHPFTLEQWQALKEEQKAAVEAVAIQLSDYGLTEQGEMTDDSFRARSTCSAPARAACRTMKSP